MAHLAALHRKNQSRRDVADIDEVHDEVEIQLKAAGKEMPEHRCRRGKIVSCGPIGIVGVPITTGNPVPLPEPRTFREHFRASVRTGHFVGRQQGFLSRIVSDGERRKRMDSVEQCNNRPTPCLRAAEMTISVPRQLTA